MALSLRKLRISDIEAWIRINPGRRITAVSIVNQYGISLQAAAHYLSKIASRNPEFERPMPGAIIYHLEGVRYEEGGES